jgi:phage regulator Rha-like protein
MTDLISMESIINKIFIIRKQKVMLDRDLAELYGVETKNLKRAVKRNIDRFPSDFMLELSQEEYSALRCHFGTLEKGAHSKYLAYVFTEHGILMLSSVLNSPRAIKVNIQIMRTFSKMRKSILNYKKIEQKITALEAKYDQQLNAIFKAINHMFTLETKSKKIGFVRDKEE